MIGELHHLELWVTDLTQAKATLGWLLLRLGYVERDQWATGVSFGLGASYIVLDSGPHVSGPHDRCAAGMNHLALWAGGRADVDVIAQEAAQHGWTLLFAEHHPFAGGPDHYAAYLANEAGFEVELVAWPS